MHERLRELNSNALLVRPTLRGASGWRMFLKVLPPLRRAVVYREIALRNAQFELRRDCEIRYVRNYVSAVVFFLCV